MSAATSKTCENHARISPSERKKRKMPNRSIFLIDDDKSWNFLHETTIVRAGIRLDVCTFENPSVALAMLGDMAATDFRVIPEVIFLDINMPVLDGWDFLDEYGKLPRYVQDACRVFVVSSSVNDSDLAKAGTYPSVAGFISKPLEVKVLHEIFNFQTKLVA